MIAKKLAPPQELDFAVLRPAIVEAKLMTPKHASDDVYVATLAEELRRIEDMIVSAEQRLKISQSAGITRTTENAENAQWFRAKSTELDRRLERIEHDGGRTLDETSHCRTPRSSE